jgi:hypothetical protein
MATRTGGEVTLHAFLTSALDLDIFGLYCHV